MIGAIIGENDNEPILIADGDYDKLERQLSVYREIASGMNVRLCKIENEQVFNESKLDISKLREFLSGMF